MGQGYRETIEALKSRLQQPLPGLKAQELMTGRVLQMPLSIPDNARQSAVLCLLFPMEEQLSLLLMKRMADKGAHSGQISFPGGRYETIDGSLLRTALREANEEVGIVQEHVEILGALTPLYIPVSNFNVHPFVGFANERPAYRLSHDEVEHILEIPLNVLLHADRKSIVDVMSPVLSQPIRKVNAYQLEDSTVIWGATAMIISELEVILKGLHVSEN